MVYFTIAALGLTYLVYRFMTRGERPKGGACGGLDDGRYRRHVDSDPGR